MLSPMPRQDTALEAEGAEFLVLGLLLAEGIQALKSYTRHPGYDLIAFDPATDRQCRIQVKSRWATDYDQGFPIKNFDADFIVLVALNRGYRYGKKRLIDEGDVGKRPPQFYVFPVSVVKSAHNPSDTWKKADTRKIPDRGSYEDNWEQIKAFLAPDSRR